MYIVLHKKIFILIGLGIVLLAGLITMIFGLRIGIDFTGGSLIEVRYETMPEKTAVEETVAALNFGEASVRESTGDAGSSYLVSLPPLSETQRQSLEEALLAVPDTTGAEIVRYTSIGPVIGGELADKAVWAIGGVLLLIVCYVALAFAGVGTPVSSWVYGFMTILMLGHDILVPIAAMSVLGYFFGTEVDILFISALLTILGFSVNDTIVIFDRVREKLKQNRTEHSIVINEPGGVSRTEVTYTLTKPFSELVGQANTETTARSINTSLAVLLSLGALYLFGGEVTENFVLILIVGVIAGAYSSIFIASPLLVAYAQWQDRNLKTTDK